MFPPSPAVATVTGRYWCVRYRARTMQS